MDGGLIMIVGKLTLTFGVLLGVPLWELYKLRKEMRETEQQES